jgi:hypothetical protein
MQALILKGKTMAAEAAKSVVSATIVATSA